MRVFVSYASEDDKLAREVAHSLKSRGHKVFIDQSDLPAGQNYEEQIEDAIKRSSLMVFLISPESVADGRLSLIHISEPTRLLSISYAVFCLKKKK